MTAFVPNPHAHLKLVKVAIEGVGTTMHSVEQSFDIVGWKFVDPEIWPVTVQGLTEPAEGETFAISNALDKSYTTLNGTRYDTWAAFLAPLYTAQESTHAAPAVVITPVRPARFHQTIG